MDCDGLKKNILEDMDGSLIGEEGFVIAFSEYAWDKDQAHGTGNYR